MRFKLFALVLPFAFALANCNSEDHSSGSRSISWRTDSNSISIPIKSSNEDKTIEVLEDSENALTAESSDPKEYKDAVARGCKYKIRKGVYHFEGSSYLLSNSLQNFNVAPEGATAIVPTFKQGVGSASLSSTSSESFSIVIIMKEDNINILCGYSAK